MAVTSRVPPSRATAARGPPAWPRARPPIGRPPAGKRARAQSPTTRAAGRPAARPHRRRTGTKAAAAAMIRAPWPTRATYPAALKPVAHHRLRLYSPMPTPAPMAARLRAPRARPAPGLAAVAASKAEKPARPTRPSGHQPKGGSDRETSRPDSTARPKAAPRGRPAEPTRRPGSVRVGLESTRVMTCHGCRSGRGKPLGVDQYVDFRACRQRRPLASAFRGHACSQRAGLPRGGRG